jgi:hypothetical protein
MSGDSRQVMRAEARGTSQKHDMRAREAAVNCSCRNAANAEHARTLKCDASHCSPEQLSIVPFILQKNQQKIMREVVCFVGPERMKVIISLCVGSRLETRGTKCQ